MLAICSDRSQRSNVLCVTVVKRVCLCLCVFFIVFLSVTMFRVLFWAEPGLKSCLCHRSNWSVNFSKTHCHSSSVFISSRVLGFVCSYMMMFKWPFVVFCHDFSCPVCVGFLSLRHGVFAITLHDLVCLYAPVLKQTTE